MRPASIEPKATEHMAEIVRLTETLIAKGLGVSSGRRCLLRSRQIWGLRATIQAEDG